MPVYLDNHATTRVDPRVLDVMLPYFTEVYGNASSKNHEFGSAAAAAVEDARARVAAAINANPREIVFTSGATEANNLAIKGVAAGARKGKHFVTCVTEHKAVIDPLKRLEAEGCQVSWLGVDARGHIDLGELRDAITGDTVLVSIMHANNEIGVIHPMAEIGRLCAEKGVLLHSDATQAVGKVPVDVEAMNIHLLSLSGHKLYGPKGVGALYVRRRNPRVRLAARMDGGGHERGLRPGTLNVPGIVGLGRAVELCVEEMPEESRRLEDLRNRLRDKLLGRLSHVKENGDPSAKLPHSLNLAFDFIDGEALLLELGDLALSTGSSCMTANPEPSYVLRALGLSAEEAKGSLRFGLGRFTTREEIDYAAERVAEGVERLRRLSPLAP